ncbi:hypothetical protein FB451DRAFT_1560128 [Mycena latifolia]|nr:hypothetical protein FB451DRAFT_1560128 [Mycena latifolia]
MLDFPTPSTMLALLRLVPTAAKTLAALLFKFLLNERFDDSDFNLHMSNSSYATALDTARFCLALATFPDIFRCGGWVLLPPSPSASRSAVTRLCFGRARARTPDLGNLALRKARLPLFSSEKRTSAPADARTPANPLVATLKTPATPLLETPASSTPFTSGAHTPFAATPNGGTSGDGVAFSLLFPSWRGGDWEFACAEARWRFAHGAICGAAVRALCGPFAVLARGEGRAGEARIWSSRARSRGGYLRAVLCAALLCMRSAARSRFSRAELALAHVMHGCRVRYARPSVPVSYEHAGPYVLRPPPERRLPRGSSSEEEEEAIRPAQWAGRVSWAGAYSLRSAAETRLQAWVFVFVGGGGGAWSPGFVGARLVLRYTRPCVGPARPRPSAPMLGPRSSVLARSRASFYVPSCPPRYHVRNHTPPPPPHLTKKIERGAGCAIQV